MLRMELDQALRAAGVDDVRSDATTRAAYSSDASLYRVTPQVVVFPRHTDEVAATMATCRDLGVPITARGAGTSVAGNSIGPGAVIDWSRHLNRVLDIDVESRTARVEPGTVHATLQRAVAGHGLRFGPDPSTHTRCTIGGMIGNNSCGSRTLGYGRTSDNVAALNVMTGLGNVLRTGYDAYGIPDSSGAEREVANLRDLVSPNLATLRTEFGRFGRQVSGYALQHLLPERGFDLTPFLVGSEGTLGLVTEATVRLVTDPPVRVLSVLGYPDIATAGDASVAVLDHDPTACEGIDSRIVDVVRQRRGEQAVPALPTGQAWLFVELAGDSLAQVLGRARRLCDTSSALDSLVVHDPSQAAALWRIREDGAGLAGRSPSGRPAYAGWEDTAVPPDQLGRYLREFDVMLTEFGLTGMPYGHFGDGCMHVRLDFPFDQPDGTTRFREFITASAELVGSYGGSLSGEHGDGRARSELLGKMYTADAIAAMAGAKHALDPANLLNPGILVDPAPFDANLRVPAAHRPRATLALAYATDSGDFSQAVHRCTGVGKCRADDSANGGVMCPSYLATREEKDSTRGRARVLQEMLNGSNVTGGWRSPEVHEALDLCLSCKGCASDCPTGVDMASYKAEVLHQSYRRRIRPRSHYSLGWLPRWSRLASRAPRLANSMMRIPGLSPALMRLAGVDTRRNLPQFAPQTFRSWFEQHPVSAGRPVTLFLDTFTNHFSPETGIAMVRVLQASGYAPRLPKKELCCGLTWISTGQLDAARRVLGRTVDELTRLSVDGAPIVGVEPSCTAVLRSDAGELLGEERTEPVRSATHTLAELLAKTPTWTPPRLDDVKVLAQPHCHHHAVMDWSPDARLLRDAGADVRRLGGCCGLAGNFGVERGHYDVSVAVAEQQLLPAVRESTGEAVVLADGFSCRTQIEDLSDRHGIHLAQLLAGRLDPTD